jgi:hypothetical protein
VICKMKHAEEKNNWTGRVCGSACVGQRSINNSKREARNEMILALVDKHFDERRELVDVIHGWRIEAGIRAREHLRVPLFTGTTCTSEASVYSNLFHALSVQAKVGAQLTKTIQRHCGATLTAFLTSSPTLDAPSRLRSSLRSSVVVPICILRFPCLPSLLSLLSPPPTHPSTNSFP